MLPGVSWSEPASRSSQRLVGRKSDVNCRFTIDMALFKEAVNAMDKELFLIEGATHIETYWKPQYVDQAMGKLTQFFGEALK